MLPKTMYRRPRDNLYAALRFGLSYYDNSTSSLTRCERSTSFHSRFLFDWHKVSLSVKRIQYAGGGTQ